MSSDKKGSHATDFEIKITISFDDTHPHTSSMISGSSWRASTERFQDKSYVLVENGINFGYFKLVGRNYSKFELVEISNICDWKDHKHLICSKKYLYRAMLIDCVIFFWKLVAALQIPILWNTLSSLWWGSLCGWKWRSKCHAVKSRIWIWSKSCIIGKWKPRGEGYTVWKYIYIFCIYVC